MHWLAVHLPDLPLEVFARARCEAGPLAVGATLKGERILRCNAAAAAAGVRPGQGIGAARALCAGLVVLPHDRAAERTALEGLAGWSQRFTPVASLAPPRSLLLDVAASLRLFDGAAALLARVEEGTGELGYAARLALAPTPLGALVLARHGSASAPGSARGSAASRWPVIDGLPALSGALGGLPLTALGLTPRELTDLGRMGLARVVDLLRLPRRGLRERLGPARMDWLERLLGEAPDPRRAYTPPAAYAGRIDLAGGLLGEIALAESLVFPCRRLLAELAGFLVGRQAGVHRLHWRLVHADCPDTGFTVAAARPLWQPDAWAELLRGHLERLVLPAPVREVALAADDLVTLSPASPDALPDLFPELPRPGRTPDRGLLDRLRARLGPDAVHGLALAPDHRPERAWRRCEPGETGTGLPRADRPLWLLPKPRQLPERDGRPWLDGPLDLGQERERIDTGWWDGFEVARDYFVATGPRGERLWIYRELKGQRGWFLHGVIG